MSTHHEVSRTRATDPPGLQGRGDEHVHTQAISKPRLMRPLLEDNDPADLLRWRWWRAAWRGPASGESMRATSGMTRRHGTRYVHNTPHPYLRRAGLPRPRSARPRTSRTPCRPSNTTLIPAATPTSAIVCRVLHPRQEADRYCHAHSFWTNGRPRNSRPRVRSLHVGSDGFNE